jgi:hypothetical protein
MPYMHWLGLYNCRDSFYEGSCMKFYWSNNLHQFSSFLLSPPIIRKTTPNYFSSSLFSLKPFSVSLCPLHLSFTTAYKSITCESEGVTEWEKICRQYREVRRAGRGRVSVAVHDDMTMLGDGGDRASLSVFPLLWNVLSIFYFFSVAFFFCVGEDGWRLEVVVMCGGFGEWW